MTSLPALIRSGLVWRASPPAQALRYERCDTAYCKELNEVLCDPPLDRQSSSCASSSSANSSSTSGSRLSAPFHIPEIDLELPCQGLPFGTIHEWIGNSALTPPFSMVTVLAYHGWKAAISAQRENPVPRFTLWIGKESWPHPSLLWGVAAKDQAQAQLFTRHALFVDISDEKQKLWCVETALRSPAVSAVITSTGTTSTSVNRRLFLAAQRGNSLGFFLKPLNCLLTPTSATSRWRVSPAPSADHHSRWHLQLLKYKGRLVQNSSWFVKMHSGDSYSRAEQLYEHRSPALSLHLSPDMVNQSGDTQQTSAAAITADSYNQPDIDQLVRAG